MPPKYRYSKTREAVPTPESIVDAQGNAQLGTFDREFERLNFLDIDRPGGAGRLGTRALTQLRLTRWEAIEVHVEGGVLLVGVCHMGVAGMSVAVFYDKARREVTSFNVTTPPSRVVIAPNLLRGAVTELRWGRQRAKFVNRFEEGRASFEGSYASRDSGQLDFRFELDNLSDPSVVSIPFPPRGRPLYSQKNFFKVSGGQLVINGRSYPVGEDSVAIIDDHRGFYPRRSHYDWVTTLGRQRNGAREYFAFNLTRNQSTDQDAYNENILWLEGESHLLPPVHFSRDYYTGDGRWGNPRVARRVPDASEWRVEDEHGLVDLRFHVRDTFHMVIPALVVDVDYHIMFGELSGFITDPQGQRYSLDGLVGIGEDKSLLW